ncbi:MAG: hypothetical protein GY849_02495 [Deltaproteobacteria bacterium]|nr:hypothetical protein [Deltaproteobacteria bacterium]
MKKIFKKLLTKNFDFEFKDYVLDEIQNITGSKKEPTEKEIFLYLTDFYINKKKDEIKSL